jgi:hypothetical protein
MYTHVGDLPAGQIRIRLSIRGLFVEDSLCGECGSLIDQLGASEYKAIKESCSRPGGCGRDH